MRVDVTGRGCGRVCGWGVGGRGVPTAAWAGGLLALGLGLLFLVGCGGQTEADAAEYEYVYTVRARVLQLHDGSPTGEFQARHEAIPDYQAANGNVGMASMQMPFQIVDFAVQEGVAVGDIVEITYGETHRPRVRQGVISINQLPNDTVLELGEETP